MFFHPSFVYGLLALFSLLGACANAERVVTEPRRQQESVRDAIETVRVHIQTVRGAVALDAEIASGRGNQLRGLMGRTRLPPDAGMLFIYHHAQAPDAGFWMFRTHLPLDIAFLDAEGRIFAIHAMVPCVSLLPWRCPTYAPDAPYWAALEVNREFFARHSIYVGDQVVLPASWDTR